MNKSLSAGLFLIISGMMAFAQTPSVIVQWTFPNGVDSLDKFPDGGLSLNSKNYISAEDTTAYPNTVKRTLTYTNGVSNYAATATHWHNGSNAKLWSIKFKTNGATNLTVSSKQRSGGNTPGPKYWKIQAMVSGGSWIDIPNGNVTVANNWTAGVVTDIALPSSFDNTTKSIFIRWIVVSDSSTNGTIVDSNGLSKIDDVVVKGIIPSSIEDLNNISFAVYPIPNNSGVLYFNTNDQISSVQIFNLNGTCISTSKPIDNKMDINYLSTGVYFLRIEFIDHIQYTRLIVN